MKITSTRNLWPVVTVIALVGFLTGSVHNRGLVTTLKALTPQQMGSESENGVIVYGAGRPAPVPEATLFAFDDVSIPFKQDLVLQMHPGEKHPANPVVKRGGKGSPDEYRAQYLGSVIRQGGKFKMWYIAADAEAIAAL